MTELYEGKPSVYLDNVMGDITYNTNEENKRHFKEYYVAAAAAAATNTADKNISVITNKGFFIYISSVYANLYYYYTLIFCFVNSTF